MLLFVPIKALTFEIGVSTHIDGYKQKPEHYLTLMKSMGVTSFRNDYWWSQLEQFKNNYTVTSKLDKSTKIFESSSQQGISGMLILGYGNKLYSSGDYPRTEEDVDAFINYVQWVVTRFKHKVKYYEIWNEWYQGTGMGSYSKNKPTDEQYIQFISKVYKKIKEIDPEAIVIAGGFNPLVGKQRVWFSGLVDKGFLNNIDGVSIHPYSYYRGSEYRTAEANMAVIDEFHNSYSQKNINFPMYITELGIPNGLLKNSYTENDSAQFIMQYIQLAKQRDFIKGVWFYDLIDDGKNPFDYEQNFGLLKNNEEPKIIGEKLMKSTGALNGSEG